jgi:pimeloyl-ACP methyl ester carboxylesterase
VTGPQRHWIELPDARLEAAWWGPGPEAAPTIALLHEGLGCVALWRDFPAVLADASGCGVLAWSRVGYGASSPVSLPRPISYMHDEARGRVSPVLSAMGVRRCLLLGHSDGASIATIYAGSVADARVAGLALLTPHFVVEDVSLKGIRDARRRWNTTDLRSRLARYHQDVDGAFLGWNQAWLTPEFRGWDIRPELARIEKPMLVIQGTADAYGTVEQLRLAERLARGPVEGVVLEGIGHAPQFEAPEATLGAVTEFARDILDSAK